MNDKQPEYVWCVMVTRGDDYLYTELWSVYKTEEAANRKVAWLTEKERQANPHTRPNRTFDVERELLLD